MASNLQVGQELGSAAQSVLDQAGTVSQLAISTDSVGIGTTKPRARADIVSTAPADANDGQLRISERNGNFMLIGRADTYGFLQSHNREPLCLNPLGNNVGIGTTNPREALEVKGNVVATGDIKLANADAAEEFDAHMVSGGTLEPGDVMVLGDDGCLRLSHAPYDRRVAGVIAGAADQRPGIILGHDRSRQRPVQIALMGRVICKADAAAGPIAVGDLLTTSSSPGHAERVIDHDRAFGAVIGKAMGRLDAGRGLVPMLIALQ
jgi:hypothetical protein